MIERRYVVDCDGCGDRLSGIFTTRAEAERGARRAEWRFRTVKRDGETVRALHCKRCSAE